MNEPTITIQRRHTFTWISDSLLEDGNVTSNDLLTYIAIAKHAGKDRTAFPGVPRIAKLARISERSVQRALKHLELLGYMNVERRKDPHNPTRNLSNNYILNDYSGVVTESHQGGDTVTPGVVTGSHPNKNQSELETFNNNQNTLEKEAHTDQPAATDEQAAIVDVVMKSLGKHGIQRNTKTLELVKSAIDKGVTGENVDTSFQTLLETVQSKSTISNKPMYALKTLATTGPQEAKKPVKDSIPSKEATSAWIDAEEKREAEIRAYNKAHPEEMERVIEESRRAREQWGKADAEHSTVRADATAM